MERTKREILAEFKDKAPELYSEILTEQEKETLEVNECSERPRHCGGMHHRHQNCEGRKQWGGYRQGAGRPKTFCSRKPITKHISEDSIEKIKEYASTNDISENLAIEKLINAGYDVLKNNKEKY